MMTLLSLLPILIILLCILLFRLSAVLSGAISFLAAVIIAFFFFKVYGGGLLISMSKGIGLAVFLLLILWAAMFLYNLVKETTALEVINRNIEGIVQDRFIQFILLSWVFSAFLQGIAGLGVPVIIITPVLIGLGFEPVVSAAAVLVGHSWAISFGSMGSSIYAMDMVTRENIGDIVLYMALFGTVAMFCTGISVSFMYGGLKSAVKSLPLILILTTGMGIMLFIMAYFEMFSVIGLMTGLFGCIILFSIYKIPVKNRRKHVEFFKTKLSLFQATLPYLLVILLSVLFIIINPSVILNLNYSGYETGTGRIVPSEAAYVSFNIFKHPFTVILIASIISIIVFIRKDVFDFSTAKIILLSTVKRCSGVSFTVIFILMMAVIMIDSGMIDLLATGAVSLSKGAYPLFAPFIGLLGAFITGSNTNSNIIFGNLQETIASHLELYPAIMCAVGSIGASIGGGIGPTTVVLGASSAGIQGNEFSIYKKTLIPVLVTALILGIINLIFFS